jgi:hypothetical protein
VKLKKTPNQPTNQTQPEAKKRKHKNQAQQQKLNRPSRLRLPLLH